MWHKFTAESRLVIFVAQEAARKRCVGLVQPEHLLIGVLHVADERLDQVLSAFSQSRGSVQVIADQAAGEEVEGECPDDFRLSEDAKKVIDIVFTVARELKSKVIRPEHIFLALLRHDGVPGRFLIDLGFDLPKALKVAESL